MKKNDILTVIGFVLAVGLMVFGMTNGSSIMLFFDVSSLAITFGGSIGAVLITVQLADFKKVGKLFAEAFKEPNLSKFELISQFSDLSKKARREGLLSLEDAINNIDNDFLKKGLQMVVDGMEADSIRDILELEIGEMEQRHKSGANIFTTWAAFAPGFGMLGTLIGLIQMLSNLTDASTIASGMGKALITTFYGSIISNMLASPIAQNLMLKSAKEVTIREMMVEGILAIQSGVNPRIVEEKLISYLSPAEKKDYVSSSSNSNEGAA